MLILGLTGGIACGKSNISDVLSDLGAVIVDGDKLSRQLTAPGGEALTPLLSAFGSGCFHEDGTLDRKALGSLIFGNEDARKKLDDIMQPLIREKIREEILQADSSGAEVCVLDMPLLYEKGLDSLCNRVWAACLPRDIQLERLMKRDGLTAEEAEKRIRSQMPASRKAELADVMIDTSGTIEETRSKIPALYRAELERAAANTPSDSGNAAAAPRRRRPSAGSEPKTGSDPEPASIPASSAGRKAFTSSEPERKVPVSPLPAQPDLTDSQIARDRPEDPVRRSTQRNTRAPAAAADDPERFHDVMERPSAARKGPSQRRKKDSVDIPSPLRAALILCAALIAVAVSSVFLMRAYQVRKHQEAETATLLTLNRYPRSSEYSQLIEKYAEEYNLDPAFVSAIILNESSYDRLAVSNVGARGLMQLMSDTAEWIAGKLKMTDYSFERMFDPETNIRFGCWYLHFLAERFNGDVVCVACAYHAGQGEISSWLDDPSMSEDGLTLKLDRLKKGPTRTYAERVTKAYGIYKALYYPEAEASEPAAVSPVPYPG